MMLLPCSNNKYIRQLTQYGLKFISDLPAVEDCLHDVFVWLWANRQKLNIHSSVKSYLFKSVRASMLHWLQKQHRLQTLNTGDEPSCPFELQLTPETLFVHNEQRRLIIVSVFIKLLANLLTFCSGCVGLD